MDSSGLQLCVWNFSHFQVSGKEGNEHLPAINSTCELHPVLSKGDAEGVEFLAGERARNTEGRMKKHCLSKFPRCTQFIACHCMGVQNV